MKGKHIARKSPARRLRTFQSGIQRNHAQSPNGAGSLSKLPHEILMMIMEVLHQQDLPVTPIVLVCKTLMRLIITAPRLWRRIIVSVDPIPASLQLGSTIFCHGEPILRACVERVRYSPIEATLVIGQITEDSPSASVRAERFKMVLEKSSQITFLCCIINIGTPLSKVIDSFGHIFTSSLESLESLMIASATPISGLISAFGGLFDRLNKTSTRLRSLYMENVSNDFVMIASDQPFWSKLSRVTLKGTYQPLHVEIFTRSNNLEFLFFTGELLTGPEGARPTCDPQPCLTSPPDTVPSLATSCQPDEISHGINLPRLQWLRVGSITMYGLSQLVMPRLRFLVIQTALHQRARKPPVPHSIVYPELEILHISGAHSSLRCIAAPKLETLCLQIPVLKSSDAKSILRGVFDGHRSMLRPKNLTLSSLVHDRDIIPILKRLFRLETLTLVRESQPNQIFFDSFLSRSFLPLLTGFTLEFRTPVEKHQNYIEDITKNMLKVRSNRYRRKLTRLSAKWDDAERVFVRCDACNDGHAVHYLRNDLVNENGNRNQSEEAHQIFVQTSTGVKIIRLNVGKDTVDHLRRLISAKVYLPLDSIRLLYAGKQLEDYRLLGDYGIENESTVHLVHSLRGGFNFSWRIFPMKKDGPNWPESPPIPPKFLCLYYQERAAMTVWNPDFAAFRTNARRFFNISRPVTFFTQLAMFPNIRLEIDPDCWPDTKDIISEVWIINDLPPTPVG